MAVPVKRKIKHYRGDDFRVTFRVEKYVTEGDPDSGTEPRDLTGWTAEVESHPDVQATTSPDPLDATGVVTVDIPAVDLGDEQTALVEFDVTLVDTQAFRRTYFHVIISLVDQVS